MTEANRPLTVHEMSRRGLEKRWSNTTPEQRREATRKATEASLRARAAKKAARENGGSDDNA